MSCAGRSLRAVLTCIVGAGVSIAASLDPDRKASVASWIGLLEDGINRCMVSRAWSPRPVARPDARGASRWERRATASRCSTWPRADHGGSSARPVRRRVEALAARDGGRAARAASDVPKALEGSACRCSRPTTTTSSRMLDGSAGSRLARDVRRRASAAWRRGSGHRALARALAESRRTWSAGCTLLRAQITPEPARAGGAPGPANDENTAFRRVRGRARRSQLRCAAALVERGFRQLGGSALSTGAGRGAGEGAGAAQAGGAGVRAGLWGEARGSRTISGSPTRLVGA